MAQINKAEPIEKTEVGRKVLWSELGPTNQSLKEGPTGKTEVGRKGK